MPSSSCSARAASMASMAHPAWSDCRWKPPSLRRSSSLRQSNSTNVPSAQKEGRRVVRRPKRVLNFDKLFATASQHEPADGQSQQSRRLGDRIHRELTGDPCLIAGGNVKVQLDTDIRGDSPASNRNRQAKVGVGGCRVKRRGGQREGIVQQLLDGCAVNQGGID